MSREREAPHRMQNLNGTAVIALETLGCKLNQAESESLARQFCDAGYHLAGFQDRADIYIVNTCTVTHVADRKSRHLLRLAHRRNPNALIIATGCYAERAPEEIARIEGVGLIIGNEDKEQVANIVQAIETKRGKDLPWGRHHVSSMFRTRGLVKIQDGCNQSCSYCIVPQTRGKERSVPPERVIDEIKARVAAGCQEVVLTGTQIGDYGQDRGDTNLQNLVQRILAETRIERLRLPSVQPQDLSPEFIKLWTDRRLCRHLHLPLQSGSDAVLQRMRRRYSTSDYEHAVARARAIVPDMAITSDLIVGFPGEDKHEFEENYQFCQQIGFAGLHIFPYSARPSTMAAQMPHKVDDGIKKERSKKMLRLANESKQRFQEQFLGQTVMVLWEGKQDEQNLWAGLTDNYVRVFASSQQPLTNLLLPVRVVGRYGQGLWGELVS